MKRVFLLLKTAGVRWYTHDALLHSAALSFYTIVTLPALLILLLSLGGLFLSDTMIQQEIVKYARVLFGEPAVILVDRMIISLPASFTLQFRSLAGGFLLLLTASALFSQLRQTMNAMWDIGEQRTGGIRHFFLRRIVLFCIVLLFGFIVVASVLMDFIYTVASDYFVQFFPWVARLFEWIGGSLSFLLIGTIVMLVYKYLSDAHIRWKDVFVGAAVSTVLLIAGKIFIGWYLSRQILQNLYGAAGTLFIFLLWVYYSSLVFLYGLQCTYLYAEWFGHTIRPAPGVYHRLSWRLFIRQKWEARRLFRSKL